MESTADAADALRSNKMQVSMRWGVEGTGLAKRRLFENVGSSLHVHA
jgi:hypothetical protein